MTIGHIKRFNPDRGFGFIVTEDNDDVFVHYSEFPEDLEPKVGMRVEFTMTDTPKGLRASNVKVLPEYTDVI